jgi:predicted Zn finger-like uncharacterized protein
MIVSCQACSTRYLIEPAALGPKGRLVRCAKCGHSWQQIPPADMPLRVDADVPPPGRVDLPQAPAPERRWTRGLGLPLMITVLVLIAIGGGYVFRDPVVARWPAAAQIYELIGVATRTGLPLKVANITYARKAAGADTLLQIQGDVFNPTDTELPLPQLKARLRDRDGKLLDEWTFDLERESIEPGEVISFSTETRNPPADATEIGIDFVAK